MGMRCFLNDAHSEAMAVINNKPMSGLYPSVSKLINKLDV